MQGFSAGVFYSWLLLACFFCESYLKLSTINKSVIIVWKWDKDHSHLDEAAHQTGPAHLHMNIPKILVYLLHRIKLLYNNVNKEKKHVRKPNVRSHVTQELYEIGVYFKISATVCRLNKLFLYETNYCLFFSINIIEQHSKLKSHSYQAPKF